jgi:hypothetical protein
MFTMKMWFESESESDIFQSTTDFTSQTTISDLILLLLNNDKCRLYEQHK